MPFPKVESTPEQKARKLRVDHRLTQEDKRVPGRKAEALAFKAAATSEARRTMSFADAGEFGWDELERAYPPLPADDPGEAVEVSENPGELESAAEKAPPGRYVGHQPIPAEWPEFGPSNYREDVRWVYENFGAIMPVGKSKRLKLDRAKSPAPSSSAVGLALGYIGNRNKFFDLIVPKVLGGVEDSESENIREAEMRAEEIEAVLRKYDRKAKA